MREREMCERGERKVLSNKEQILQHLLVQCRSMPNAKAFEICIFLMFGGPNTK